MQRQALLALVAVVFFASIAAFYVTPALTSNTPVFAAEDGEAVFLKYNCNNCHSVSTAGITAKLKTKAPDLVNVTVRHEKPWIRTYIRKQKGHVPCPKVNSSRNGKLHSVEFKGTREEEDALIEWLDQQRTEE